MSKTKANKNPNGAGSIRKRADGRWEGRYSNGWTKTGHQRQKSIYGKTQQEVRQKMAKVIAEIAEGTYIEPSKIKLSEWLDIWLNEYCGDKKYSTVKGYRANVNTHIKPELGHIPLGKLTTTDIQKFYNRLLNPPDGSPGICPKTIKNTNGVLSKAMSVAVVNGYIRSNPCVGTILPRVEKHEVEPLTVMKGINQIAQEGAIQIFQEYNTGMEEIIVGVVGVLQFDVLKFRLENEYNVQIKMENLPYEHIRWIRNPEEIDLDRIQGTSDMKKVKDLKDRPLLLFVNSWSVGMVADRNENLVLTEFAKN